MTKVLESGTVQDTAVLDVDMIDMSELRDGFHVITLNHDPLDVEYEYDCFTFQEWCKIVGFDPEKRQYLREITDDTSDMSKVQ